MQRRTILKAAALLPLGARVVSAAPPPEAITPALIEAAKKEGKVSYYTAMDLSVAEPLAKAAAWGKAALARRTTASQMPKRVARSASLQARISSKVRQQPRHR